VKRRLKGGGVEVGVSEAAGYTHGDFFIHVAGREILLTRNSLEALTEPIPEPEGPQVGDEVMAEWLDDEWDCGRYHVVRNPDGSAGSWTARVDGTDPVWKSDGEAAGRDDGPWPLLALHPVERWEEPTPTPPVDPLIRAADHFRERINERINREVSMHVHGTPTPPVDPVEQPEILFCEYRLFRQPDGTLRDQHGDTWRGSLKEGLIGPMKDGVDYTIKARPLKPVDPVEEAWEKVEQWDVVEAGHIRAAVEATLAPLREQVQALSDRVLDLDEQIIDLRNRGETRAVRTVRTVAEKDAAGGEEGPSVEEVLAWLEYLGGDGPMPRLMGDARTFPATAIRLIREGQRDTRAVLTEEMVERACEAACPVGTDCEPWHTRYESHKAWFRRAMRRALLSTGLVREADHGE
jgi:hypothetical protein